MHRHRVGINADSAIDLLAENVGVPGMAGRVKEASDHDVEQGHRLVPPRVEGLAEELAVKVSFVRRLAWERRIPYFKIGKLVWFDLGEVHDWLDSHCVDALR